MRKFRPRHHRAFGKKQREAARAVIEDAQKFALDARALPRREQNVQQLGLFAPSAPGKSRSWGSRDLYISGEHIQAHHNVRDGLEMKKAMARWSEESPGRARAEDYRPVRKEGPETAELVT